MRFTDATTPRAGDDPTPKPHLVAVWDGGVASIPLPEKGAVVVGRGKDSDFVVDHSSVSRRHAVLYVTPKKGAFTLRIEDQGSSNGTFVGSRRLEPRVPAQLTGREEVLVGSVSLLVRFGIAPVGPSDGEEVEGSSPGLREDVHAFERERVLLALQRCGGNQTVAARSLGVSRRTLVRRLGEWGITKPRDP